MPEEGIEKKRHEEMMSAEETLAAVKAAVSLGINKIRITGGEPLVKRGIVRLCGEIAHLAGVKELCMTTNGTLLREFAKPLKEAGLDRLNISLDTLDSEKFAYITRRGRLKDALDGIDAAFEAGFDNIKLNVVLMGGFNDDEITDFIDMTVDRELEVRFIELMPIGGGIDFDKAKFISCGTVLEKAPRLTSLGITDGVASMYAMPNAKGRVGLIRPISCEFCDRCNKIRLTADGMLKPCLHLDGEVSIKGLSESEMAEVMKKVIMGKPKMRGVMNAENPSRAGRNMNSIGG